MRGRKNVAVPKTDQRPMLRAVNQLQLGFQNDRASSFRPHQRPRNIEIVLRQQLIEVVSRYPPWNFRKPRPDQYRVLFLDRPQLRINLSVAAALLNDAFQLRLASSPHRYRRAVVKQNSQLLYVIDSLPAEQRVCPARIISDHSADSAAIVRRRIRRKRQLVLFCPIAKRIQDHSRLNARKSLL